MSPQGVSMLLTVTAEQTRHWNYSFMGARVKHSKNQVCMERHLLLSHLSRTLEDESKTLDIETTAPVCSLLLTVYLYHTKAIPKCMKDITK